MDEKKSTATPVSKSHRQPGGKEVLGTGQVKGGMLKSHLQWLHEHKTAEEVSAFLASLSEKTRKDLSGILTSSWYPFATLIELDRGVAKAFGGSQPDQLIRDMGRYSARINLTTTYRAFNREDLHEFFRTSAVLHSQFQNFGTAVYERVGPSKGVMRYSKYTSMSPVYCESALGFFEQATLIQGAPMSIVEERTCQCHGAANCEFEISWG